MAMVAAAPPRTSKSVSPWISCTKIRGGRRTAAVSFRRVRFVARASSIGEGSSSDSSSPWQQQQQEDLRGMSFWARLQLAWSVLFAPRRRSNRQGSSNAEIAKQRLKMILIADRCAVSDAAKRKIVANIVGALSDFVEIESEDKVQLNVTTDLELGTIYSVTVPVRRVKPEYQDLKAQLQNVQIAAGEGLSCDVTLDFPSES